MREQIRESCHQEKCSVVKKWHKSGKNAVIKRLNRQTSVFSKWSTAVVQFLSLKGKLSALPYFFLLRWNVHTHAWLQNTNAFICEVRWTMNSLAKISSALQNEIKLSTNVSTVLTLWEESLLFSYNKYVWELAPSLVEPCSCTNLWRNFKNSGHEGAAIWGDQAKA